MSDIEQLAKATRQARNAVKTQRSSLNRWITISGYIVLAASIGWVAWQGQRLADRCAAIEAENEKAIARATVVPPPRPADALLEEPLIVTPQGTYPMRRSRSPEDESAIAEAASLRGAVPLLDCRMALAEANVKRIRELPGAGAAILPSADWQARNAELYRREAQVKRDVEIILDIRRQLHMVYMASFGAKDGPDVSGPLGRWNYLQAILNPEQYLAIRLQPDGWTR